MTTYTRITSELYNKSSLIVIATLLSEDDKTTMCSKMDTMQMSKLRGNMHAAYITAKTRRHHSMTIYSTQYNDLKNRKLKPLSAFHKMLTFNILPKWHKTTTTTKPTRNVVSNNKRIKQFVSLLHVHCYPPLGHCVLIVFSNWNCSTKLSCILLSYSSNSFCSNTPVAFRPVVV